MKLKKIEFRGWDVESSVEAGTPRTGASRWTSGEGEFEVGEQKLRFDAIRLEAPRARSRMAGTIGFDMESNLTFAPGARDKRGRETTHAARELRVSGPLENPTVVVQPASAAGKRP